MAVNGTNLIKIPNTDYPTARVNAYSMFSGDSDLITAGVRFGYTTAGGAGGSTTGAYRAVITITLPEIYDVHGDTTKTLYNSDTPVGDIKDIMVELNPSGDRNNAGKYVVYYVKKYLRQYKPGIDGSAGSGLPHSTKHVKFDRLTWDGYANSEMQAGNTVDIDHNTAGGVASAWGFLEWAVPGAFLKGPPADSTGAADLDQATDYGHGPNGKIHLFNVEDDGVNIQIPLADLLKSKSLTWGDTFQILIKNEGQVHDSSDVLEDAEWGDEAGMATVNDITCAADTFSGAVSSSFAMVHIMYEDSPPTKPIIKMAADTDYITPVITFDTFPTESDLQTVKLHWNTSNTFTTGSTGGAEGNVNLTSFNQATYKDLKGATFLATGNQQYYLTPIAADNTNYIQGNVIAKKRMTCSGSLSAGTAIGTQLTLTITGANGDYSGKFIKYGVNWNGDGTPGNDSLSDYNIVTLNEEATSATITHTFDKSIGGNYNINIFTVDRDGFRSDFTTGATRNIVVSNPVANINASRDSLVRGRYGDDFSVCTLSGAHSYAIGSNRKIQNHAFQHNQTTRTTPVSTSPMENNNTNFNTISKKIKLKCNHANCADTEVKVFGRVSVDSSGGNDPDNVAVFDHYEMKAVTLSPSDSADDGASAGFGSASSEYFKSVDFVAITNLDAQDGASTGTYYTLTDSDGNIINNQIRGTPSDWSWGGYVAGASTGNIAFTAATKRITRASGSWIADGFAVGDTIYCSGPDEAANNRYFTIASLTATIITVNETVTEDGTDAGVSVYKINGPTLTFTCMDENSPTITHTVNDTNAEPEANATSSQTASNVTQSIIFESEEYHTLDLDSQADSGNIAILNSQFKRNGGLTGVMPLGNRRYPIGTTRTRLGSPAISLSVRVLNQAGYRALWNLIEGDRYNWATIDSKKVDSPSTAYKQVRMRLVDGTLTKDPSMASQYTAGLNFIVIGELVV
jgi:hypothetical protein